MDVKNRYIVRVVGWLFLGLFSGLWAQEVNEEEIQKGQPFEFENYSGPYSRIDSVEAITQIGTDLANAIENIDSSQTVEGARYSIRHVYNPDEEGLSADILILEADSEPSHIENIWLIISGYLQVAYNYTEEEALTVATFITYYNAAYARDIEYFEQNYTLQVVSNLSADKVGILRRYSDWPGQTELVIPLRSRLGEEGLSNVDLGEIASDEVIDEIRREDDELGLDDRKELAEIREKEVIEETERIEELENGTQDDSNSEEDSTNEEENSDSEENATNEEDDSGSEDNAEDSSPTEDNAPNEEDDSSSEDTTEDNTLTEETTETTEENASNEDKQEDPRP